MLYCFFDLETTGLDVTKAGIISLSYLFTDGYQEFERGTIEMNPFLEGKYNTLKESKKALEVNGYKPAQIKKFQSVKSGLEKFTEILGNASAKYNNGRWVTMVGYNSCAYDMPLLNNSYRTEGLVILDDYRKDGSTKPAFQQFTSFNCDDVMVTINTLKNMGVLPNYRGGKLCENATHFGIKTDPSNFHASMYDVEVTFEIWKRLRSRIKDIFHTKSIIKELL